MTMSRLSEEPIIVILKEHQARLGAKESYAQAWRYGGVWTCRDLLPLLLLHLPKNETDYGA